MAPFSIFEITALGMVADAWSAALYFAFIGRRLLPDRQSMGGCWATGGG